MILTVYFHFNFNDKAHGCAEEKNLGLRHSFGKTQSEGYESHVSSNVSHTRHYSHLKEQSFVFLSM